MNKLLAASTAAWVLVIAAQTASADDQARDPFPPSLEPAMLAAPLHRPIATAYEESACPQNYRPGVAASPPAGRCWVRGEYLLWWIKDADIPPLVTTGPISDPIPGALGQPGTTVLFGDELDYGALNGARFTAGTWLDDCRTHGVETSFFFLEEGTDDLAAASSGLPGSPILGRPFFDVEAGAPSVEFIAFPDVATGQIDISSSSRLWGGEVNGLCNLWCVRACGCNPRSHRADLIYGFRYLDLEESLGIGERVTLLTDVPAGGVFPTMPAVAGTQFGIFDQFETRNRFYGGQVGMRWETRRGRAFLWLLGKLALGSTHQNVRISGQSVVDVPGAGRQVFPGGELAQPTNIGEHSRDRFSVVPEIGLTAGYQVTDRLSLLAGYTFLYWSDVVRPGDQIDPAINPTQRFGGTLSGAPRPAFTFDETDFWAQGLNFGAEYRF